MDAQRPRLQTTPQQARQQLAVAAAHRGSPSRDRLIHASGTAILGLTIGVYMAAQNIVSGASEIVMTAVFAAICLGQAYWVENVARTVPRRSRLWSRIGIGASIAVALAGVMPWLNLSARSEPNTWPMVLAGAAMAAGPSLVAAVVIACRYR